MCPYFVLKVCYVLGYATVIQLLREECNLEGPSGASLCFA